MLLLDHFCPSACYSVTLRYCVQTNEDTIVRLSPSLEDAIASLHHSTKPVGS